MKHTLALGLVFTSAALGQVASPAQRLGASVFKRQAFDPDESSGYGENCVDAFGAGYIQCRPESTTRTMLCINPDLGETCCQNLWGCPSDSFCLINDLCCPDGLDPATCASQNGVTLPADFGTTPSTSSSMAAPTTSITPTVSHQSVLPTTTAYSVPGNVSTTGTAAPSKTSSPVVVNGAARKHDIVFDGMGVVAAFLGFAGLVL